MRLVHCRGAVVRRGEPLRDSRVGANRLPMRVPRVWAREARLSMQALPVPSLLSDYLPLAIFIGVSMVIGLALLIAPFAVAYSKPDAEKLSAYECGFNAFDDARMKFDVRFYLVSILFIIFDLEVAFLFPWAVAF